ncbi:MAG: archease [Gemmatimonadota bacterium]|nr:MAG: archease [Gemmatimonadota bacterium]
MDAARDSRPEAPAKPPRSEDPPAEVVPGVREFDHTADLGMAVSAPDLAELFRRAARGMARLMRESAARPPAGAATSCRVQLASGSPDLLLVAWLSELLYLDEVEGLVFEDAIFDDPGALAEGQLAATVTSRPTHSLPERQLKGVTYHGLRLEPGVEGWEAEVIFDI